MTLHGAYTVWSPITELNSTYIIVVLRNTPLNRFIVHWVCFAIDYFCK